MRLSRLDLNLLIVLDALLVERSVTRAAKIINLSQPATSGALARLREYFEDELLVRVGSTMKLTPLAESLAKPVHNILLQIQATVEKKPEFNCADSDRCFHFMVSDYVATVFMPQLIRQVAQVAPGVRFEFTFNTDSPADALEEGNIDFLLQPKQALSDLHPFCYLFEESFVCVGCANNPGLKKTLTLARYLELGHVTVHFGKQRVPSVDTTLMKEFGIEPRIDVIATTFSSVAQYLVGTARIATMHRRLAQMWAEYLPLKIMPVPVDLPQLESSLQWHKYKDNDPGIDWMRQMILQTAAQF
ncbi:MAG: LysR family transcriptional regulator [Spongiibacteraceae bacterium]|nr:LysR family transcriptional regulator [Spongiibacteraceae bacterium]